MPACDPRQIGRCSAEAVEPNRLRSWLVEALGSGWHEAVDATPRFRDLCDGVT